MPVASCVVEMSLDASESLLEAYHRRRRRFRRRVRRQLQDQAQNEDQVLEEGSTSTSSDASAPVEEASVSVDEAAVVGDAVAGDVPCPVDEAAATSDTGDVTTADGVDLDVALPLDGASSDETMSLERIERARELDRLEQVLLQENSDFHNHC